MESARLERPFRVIAFDWDGTAVVGRKDDASAVCKLLERLMRRGVAVVVITGTNLPNITSQLAPLIRDAGEASRRLFIATNRGSEVHGFDGRARPVPLFRRSASPEEERQLTAAAEAVRERLHARAGLTVRIVYDRLNRRKIDLIPLPEWADPPKSEIGRLLEAVQSRLFAAGVRGGLQEVLRLAEEEAAKAGLRDARVTSDVKHVEIGLTDKSDSIDWMLREVCHRNGVRPEEVLLGGDEFGPIGGVEGSDHKMLTPGVRDAVVVSVGLEPGGVDETVIHLGGGPARFRELLEMLADLHEGRWPAARLELPIAAATEDEGWLVQVSGTDLAKERELESVFAVGNGYLGTRAALAEHHATASSPATFLAGVFDALPSSSAVPELAVAPDWARLKVFVEGRELVLEAASTLSHRRTLDLKQGCSWREWRHRDPAGRVTLLRGFRLASLDDRHLGLQALEITPENWSGRLEVDVAVVPPSGLVAGLPVARPRMIFAGAGPAEAPLYQTAEGRVTMAVASASAVAGAGDGQPVTRSDDGTFAERWAIEVELGKTYRVHRLASFATSRESERPGTRAAAKLEEARRVGPKAIAQAHVEAWRARWEACAVEVAGDPWTQRALRFAAYHLISAANPEDDRVSIGARTLTGESYKGHVFWDTDVFMLPFFSFTWPQAARALLGYRYRTLDGARRKAKAAGYRGALYAWESADTGDETTPRFMLAPDGEVIPILSGVQEHHISADVAFAVWSHYEATGDERFLEEVGAEILLETARFWASRGAWGEDGLFHLRELIGPDEYHEGVDDNAFTNALARWNLERAAEVWRLLEQRWPAKRRALEASLLLGDEEVDEWRRVAASMALKVDPESHLIEQFAGYFALEEYDLAPLRAEGRRTAPMDMLLGRERTLRSRIVKQADVVMLLQMLWDRFPPEVREANFRFYEPRTCHGSSLSPATHALVAARLGELETAQAYFKLAAEIDLANEMGNAAGGVHAAALGGLWQAAVFGFGGVCVRGGETLGVDPHVPNAWRTLRFPLQFRGSRLVVSATADEAEVRVLSGPRVRVAIGRAPAIELGPGEKASRPVGGGQT